MNQAVTFSQIAYTILYVLPFYLSPTTRPSPNLSRDNPVVIRARIRFVSLSVIICSFSTIYVISICAGASLVEVLHLLGWYPVSILEIVKVLFLTSLLFAGPLFESGIVESGWRDWIQGHSLQDTLSSWIGFRNFVAVGLLPRPSSSSSNLAPPLPADPDSQGPITEEIIFRSLITPLHLLSRLSPTKTIFLTPLYFGIAHIHHYYEYKLTNPREKTLPALLRSLFQFAYTTLFGWYATFVFIRTGSLAAVVITHSFCNWCGLPRLWGRVEPEADTVTRERITKANEDSGSKYRSDSRRGRFRNYISGCFAIRWSVAYYVLLVAGAMAFQRGLWPLTESEGALSQLD